MSPIKAVQVCRTCNHEGFGNYCNQCGQPYAVKRITLAGLLHDAFHLFTHLDRGFGFTLKKLLLSPGYMQAAYIQGERTKHQKPFSMFFVCATIAALSRYWVFLALLRFYHTGSESEANFTHAYMVLLQMALVPLYVLVTYLLFYKTKYNYAEIGVLILYTISVIFLVAALTVLFKLIWPHLDTAYVEFPVFLLYNTITLLHFFDTLPRWEVVIKSVLIVISIFLLIQALEDVIIGFISNSSAH